MAMGTNGGPLVREVTVQPPSSCRTLLHPSFMALYTNPGVTRCCGEAQTVNPTILQELFYIDPTAASGSRIPNNVQIETDFNSFRLNTPPPIMCASLAPKSCLDPFGTGRHLTRKLGSSSWDTGAPLPAVHPTLAVIEVTQEEDQAITNLLKLRHGDGGSPSKVEGHLCPDLTNAPLCNSSGEVTMRKPWSDAELEVASVLLALFGATDEDLSLSCDLPGSVGHSVHERVLSEAEGDALCGLLNLRPA